MSDDDANLYPSPVDALKRQRDYLKARLKSEQAEVARYEELLGQPQGGLEALRDLAVEDAKATSELVAAYRVAIRKLEGRR